MPDHHLNCAFQITHCIVILRTHGPKYRHSNDHSNCAIQITHRDVTLRTQGPKYRHSNDHSNCAFRNKSQIVHFCSHVKTVLLEWELLYTPYISRGFYFREFRESVLFANSTTRENKLTSDPSIALLLDREFGHSRKCLEVQIREKLDSRNIWRIQ